MTTPIEDLAPMYGFDVHTDVREFVQQALDAGVGGSSGATSEPEAAASSGESSGED